MISINWTIFIQIANFIVLIFILNVVVYKPIRDILAQRKAKFDGLENTIVAIGKDAEIKNQAFDEGIKEARRKGHLRKEALMKAASDEEKAIIERIAAKAQENLTMVKKSIAEDIQQVQIALEKEVDAFADAISQKLLGRAAQ